MNIKNLALPKEIDARIDTDKNRIEIHYHGEGSGKFIAYYPLENMQVYVYEIDGARFPDSRDLGLRMNLSKRYLRILMCRRGRGEFTEKGISLNMSGGEFSIKIGTEDENHFDFTAESLLGVEIVLQVDEAVHESVLFKMLKASMRGIGIYKEDFQVNQWYFSSYIEESEKAIDRLIENCTKGADSEIILINAAEIAYCLGKDYHDKGSKERKYPTNSQKVIAEDMHRQLTENYSERNTAAMFAEKYSLSDTTVKNYFKNVYGYGFKEYQIKIRMEKAAELLETTDKKQVEIAMSVGYATQAKFISAFKNYYRMTPSEYRRLKKLGKILEP